MSTRDCAAPSRCCRVGAGRLLGAFLTSLLVVACGGQTSSPQRSASGPGPGLCTDSQIRMAMFSNPRFDLVLVRLRNTSNRACSMQGYPAVRLLGQHRRTLPTHLIHIDQPAARTVILDADGGWAVARLISPRAGAAQTCESGVYLKISIPHLRRSHTYQNERLYCRHGEFRVSAIFHPASGHLPLPI